MEIKELVKKLAKSLYESYRENPSDFFQGEKYYEYLNNKIVPEVDINKNDFIIALDYLEEYRCVKLDKVMSTSMPFLIRVKPRIVDFIEG